jgi:adenine C2-methylase RlmN of 23S rRNA A2503 and tRNA A37
MPLDVELLTVWEAVARRIKDRGVEVAIRKSRGTDISAACGQLRVERLTRRRPPEAE